MFFADVKGGAERDWLFTENETNYPKIFNTEGPSPYVKDAFHRYVCQGEQKAVNPARKGTKAAAHFVLKIPAGATVTVRCRLHAKIDGNEFSGLDGFEDTFRERLEEADRFYEEINPKNLSPGEEQICRQGYAGLLCCLLYTSPSPRDLSTSRMPSSA